MKALSEKSSRNNINKNKMKKNVEEIANLQNNIFLYQALREKKMHLEFKVIQETRHFIFN